MIGNMAESEHELADSRASELATPVQPSTPAQRVRYRRMIDEAVKMVLEGGDDALQMKQVALKSDVALATLYRYFPSRRHLLLAIGITRLRDNQAELRKRAPASGSTRERVAQFLLQHFRIELRHPGFRSLINQTTHSANSDCRALADEYASAFMQSLTIAAGPFTPEQAQVVPIVITAANMAASRSLAGTLSMNEARFHILAASRLLDLPSEVVANDMAAASTNGFTTT